MTNRLVWTTNNSEILKAGANFTDTMIRKGKYPEVKEKPPFSPGYDMIGIVDKLA